MRAAAVASRTSLPRTREFMPVPMLRDADAARTPRTRLDSERPASIREAIFRWLDQEL